MKKVLVIITSEAEWPEVVYCLNEAAPDNWECLTSPQRIAFGPIELIGIPISFSGTEDDLNQLWRQLEAEEAEVVTVDDLQPEEPVRSTLWADLDAITAAKLRIIAEFVDLDLESFFHHGSIEEAISAIEAEGRPEYQRAVESARQIMEEFYAS